MATQSTGKTRTAPDPARRKTEIADAALSVLAADGSRGLTHRAVDEAAGLPSGSTSNYFRTRDALLEAAARRHAELDAPPPADIDAATVPAESLTRRQGRELVLAALDHVLEPELRPMLAARYELTLESTRRPSLHPVMNESRTHFVGLATTLLRASDCKTPEAHAAQLVALMDGITADQLQDTETSLDRAGIEEAIDRFLATC
ncbi:MAG TPA: TetR family transcriptional regulator [Solirubrobacterales bacterium]|nr:TetR family transcriptional regulator [Solirubrobacterales bacterium]